MNFLKLIKFLRIKPFDSSTEAGRSQERYRLALWSFIANILSKLMALAVMLLSIRWTLPYLGEERFGVWMTVSSFATMLVVLDLGIGNALTNHAAHAAAKDNPDVLKKTISGSLGFLFIVSVIMGFILSLLATTLPLNTLIKVKDNNLLPEIRQAFLIFAILFGVNIFGSGVQKLFSGLQRTFEGLIASAICSFFALLGVALAAYFEANIPTLLLVTLGIQSLSGVILLPLLISRKQFTFVGIGHEIKRQYKTLFKSGSLYFLLQLGVLLGVGADSMIISSTLGAASVAVYSIAYRLFQMSTLAVYMLNGPLWGAYADAYARKDTAFIRITFKRSMAATIAISLLIILFLLIFNKWILAVWLNNQVDLPLSLLFAFAAWTFMECITGSFAMLLNGLHITRPQLVSMVVYIVLSLGIKLQFINQFGVITIPIATAIAYFVSKILMYRVIFYKDIKARLA
ncbi:MAG TPA: oligosaccharide flippase family protein [Burkholderiaceae bacterium]|nr:oligosaccharide flippase family protein [Burkholderiaceae bacterium]